MAASLLKLDEGNGGFASNCFPVRTLLRRDDDETGAWLVAQRVEQRRRFKAVLCAKPRTFDDIRKERKQSDKAGTTIIPPASPLGEKEEDDSAILDGFFLMKHCCVEDPADLCSVNISGQNLSDVKAEDFKLFDNVAYVNASENILPLECFNSFPILRELELPLNGLRNLKINAGDFKFVELLDLSYNNLSPDDFLPLGLLQNLRILQLTGNNLKSIPQDLARPHAADTKKSHLPRFPKLEILMLDDNALEDVTTFAALAGLRQLRHLNLAKNNLYTVPQLMLVEGRMITQIIDSRPGTQKRTRSGRKSKSQRSTRTLEEKLRSLDEARFLNSPQKREMSSPALLGSARVEQNPSEEAPQAEKSEDPALASPSGLMKDFEELDLQSIHKKIEKEQTEREIFGQHGFSDENLPLPPPFPELRYLNLAHNKMCEEDDLLAVAAWPMLSDLIVHDNPLTTERSGDPPILKRFLTDRLGIRLHRRHAPPLEKPGIEVNLKPERQVKTKVPPVPRCNVEELLAIEAPRKLASPVSPPVADSDETAPQSPTKGALQDFQSTFGVGNPLPPIPATPESGAESNPQSDASRMKESPEIKEEEAAEAREASQFDGEAFFMTQVDDPGNDKVSESHESPARDLKQSDAKHKKPKKKKIKDKSHKFYGYDELLEGGELEADPDIPEPKDVQGNLRALRYALSHPLVFRENQVHLDKPLKPFHAYQRTRMPEKPVLKSTAERTHDVLVGLRERSAVEEAPLNEVLDSQDKQKHTFPEAKALLGEVQRRYNKVRVSSMKNAKNAHMKQMSELQNIVQDTMKDVDKLASKGVKK